MTTSVFYVTYKFFFCDETNREILFKIYLEVEVVTDLYYVPNVYSAEFRPDDRNFGQFLPEYTAQFPRSHSTLTLKSRAVSVCTICSTNNQ
jgi:hypothetical protein